MNTIENTDKIENDEKKSKTNVERNTNKYTLEYLINPFYKKDKFESNINKYENERLDKEKCSFYKKRIISHTKKMLKGEYDSQELEELHKQYINSLIKHFTREDEFELLQSEYNKIDVSLNNHNHKHTDISSILIDNKYMIKKSKPNSFDNFVITKQIHDIKKIHLPKKKVLNVNTPAHKIKGIPIKQLKENDKDNT